jgi:hypothetical protein
MSGPSRSISFCDNESQSTQNLAKFITHVTLENIMSPEWIKVETHVNESSF